MLAPSWRWILVVLGIGGCARAVGPDDDPVDGFVQTDAVEDAPQTDADAVADAPETDAGPVGSSLSAGLGHTCARRVSGQVLCWGSNQSGVLGDGSAVINRPMPAAVAELTDAVEVAAGELHSCARRANGQVLCWGSNYNGQLGDGSTEGIRWTPVAVVGVTDAVEITAGYRHTCALRANGQVLCWGGNGFGELGDGSAPGIRRTPVAVAGLDDAVEVAASNLHTCARRASGQVLCWGNNDHGQLGDGSMLRRTTPVVVMGLTDAVEIAARNVHTCARRANGQVLCWGSNVQGQLGDGTTMNRTTPVAVADLTDAVELAAGHFHTCARRASGPVLCWGNNDQGQLGDGSMLRRTTSVAVEGLTDAVELAAGHFHTCARRASGPVLCWGNNDQGQLGDGTTMNLATPVAVRGL